MPRFPVLVTQIGRYMVLFTKVWTATAVGEAEMGSGL